MSWKTHFADFWSELLTHAFLVFKVPLAFYCSLVLLCDISAELANDSYKATVKLLSHTARLKFK